MLEIVQFIYRTKEPKRPKQHTRVFEQGGVDWLPTKKNSVNELIVRRCGNGHIAYL